MCCFESNLVAHNLGLAIEHTTVLVENANDLRHLGFDACEAIVSMIGLTTIVANKLMLVIDGDRREVTLKMKGRH